MSEAKAKRPRKRRLAAGCTITVVVLAALVLTFPWLYANWGRIDARLVRPDDLPYIQQRRIQAFKSEMKQYFGADLATVSVEYRKYVDSDCMDNTFAMREYWGRYTVRGVDSAIFFSVDANDLNLSSRGWDKEYKDEAFLHTSIGGPARLATLMRATARDCPSVLQFHYWRYEEEAESAQLSAGFEPGDKIDCGNRDHARMPVYAVNKYGRYRVKDIVLVGNSRDGGSDNASLVYLFGPGYDVPKLIGRASAATVFMNAVVHKGCSADDPDEWGTARGFQTYGEEYTTFEWR